MEVLLGLFIAWFAWQVIQDLAYDRRKRAEREGPHPDEVTISDDGTVGPVVHTKCYPPRVGRK